MTLGAPIGLIWPDTGASPVVQPCDGPHNIPDLIAWYDFTDIEEMQRDYSGYMVIGANNIGTAYNKSESSDRLGLWLTGCKQCGALPGCGGGTLSDCEANTRSPLYVIDGSGVNGLYYADMQHGIPNPGSVGQLLHASSYYKDSVGTHHGHLGGYGNGAGTPQGENGYLSNGDGTASNSNVFSNATITNDDLTVIWVIDTEHGTSVSTDQHHWSITHDYNDGYAETSSATWGAKSGSSGNVFKIFHDDDEGSGDYDSATGSSLSNGLTRFVAVYGSGTNGMVLRENGSAVGTGTIAQSTSYSMVKGLMSIGGRVNGLDGSGIVEHGVEGKFYEFIVYNRALSSEEITCIETYLTNKYT